MKKFKLFLFSSVLAVGFLSNSVNAMKSDKEENGSKSPAITILDLDNDCTSEILRRLPLRDVASFALTSKKGGSSSLQADVASERWAI